MEIREATKIIQALHTFSPSLHLLLHFVANCPDHFTNGV